MAIAGIVLSVTEGRLPETREALRAFHGIVDVRALEDGCKLAAVLESPSRDNRSPTLRPGSRAATGCGLRQL